MNRTDTQSRWWPIERLLQTRPGLLIAALIPVMLLAVVVALVLMTGAGLTAEPVAPIESLTIQRITLNDNGMVVSIVNGGPQQTTVAQVLVDDAMWPATAEPSATLGRLGQATIYIAYPWVEGDRHEVKLITSNGLIFAGAVEVAAPSPQPGVDAFLRFSLLGLYVGVVPVALGLMWFPFIRRLGVGGLNFVLSLTVGLLLFLVIDTIQEALEVAANLPAVMQGVPLVLFVGLGSFLALLAISRRRGAGQSRLGLAYMIALGIGMHNLGEGLAIGAAFSLGEAALGAFLVVGFTLHNITEGVGIGAPVAKERPALSHFVKLALLAGTPAIIGTWIGGFVYSDLAATIFLAAGAGAIAQVIFEVLRLLNRDASAQGRLALSPTILSGLVAGVMVMYLTAMLVKF